MKKKETTGSLMLFVTAMIWGSAFLAQQSGMEHLGPFTMQAIRYTLAGLALLPFIAICDKMGKFTKKPVTHEEKKFQYGSGAVCGVLLCAASILQQYGLLYTSVGKSGFITALYIVLVPLIRTTFSLGSGACLLAAILVLSIMVLPSIINVSETALRAVPREYEEASLALGATAAETYFRVSLHAARSGVATAVVLGVGRAIGEAMAIIMVAGNVANMPGLFRSVRFLTTGIISGMSYAPVGSLYQQALFSIGLVLFLFIMLINVFLNVFIKKRKED